ncbi:MAG: UMP kinase [Lentisphaerae bacterium]|jgi:uridylate kinase|nr:UMP kinase [Lentisphaerota bacterium]
MDKEPYFRRILLKLSGEALQGAGGSIDPDAVLATAELIREATLSGSEVAVILGAGNLFRGLTGCRKGMDRNCADYMGMLATCMNALAVRDALESLDISAEIQSALPIDGVLEPFDYRKADRLLNIGTVLLFAAGTGHPFFTTDTTAALRACEIKADAVFKATKVNGVYSEDPMKNPAAVRYERVTFRQALNERLKVMDSTAFSLCQDNNLPIVIFKFGEPGVLAEIMQGNFKNATLVSNK